MRETNEEEEQQVQVLVREQRLFRYICSSSRQAVYNENSLQDIARANQCAVYVNYKRELITRLFVDGRRGDDVKQKGTPVHNWSCQY